VIRKLGLVFVALTSVALATSILWVCFVPEFHGLLTTSKVLLASFGLLILPLTVMALSGSLLTDSSESASDATEASLETVKVSPEESRGPVMKGRDRRALASEASAT